MRTINNPQPLNSQETNTCGGNNLSDLMEYARSKPSREVADYLDGIARYGYLIENIPVQTGK